MTNFALPHINDLASQVVLQAKEQGLSAFNFTKAVAVEIKNISKRVPAGFTHMLTKTTDLHQRLCGHLFAGSVGVILGQILMVAIITAKFKLVMLCLLAAPLGFALGALMIITIFAVLKVKKII